VPCSKKIAGRLLISGIARFHCAIVFVTTNSLSRVISTAIQSLV
jgi:hypothetical protein